MIPFCDIHILQTLPPCNINRDGQGRPKTAVYGGIPRMRVSSQAWKHAIREDFRHHLDTSRLASRSREFTAMIARRLPDPVDPDTLTDITGRLMTALNLPQDKQRPGCTSALQFLGDHQWQALADTVATALHSNNPDTIIHDAKKNLLRLLDADTSCDIALFGRMSASDETGKARAFATDAAVQVAHAISVDEARIEYDYVTAVDDDPDATGFAYGEDQGYISGTLYRYAGIDIRQLDHNLNHDADALRLTIRQFLHSLIESMPSGRRNSFAPNTMPGFVAIMLRHDRPVSLVEAYEQPVTGDIMSKAVHRLTAQNHDYQTMYGLDDPIILPSATPAAADGLDDDLRNRIQPVGQLIDTAVDTIMGE